MNPDLYFRNYTKFACDQHKINDAVTSFFDIEKLPRMYLEVLLVGEDRIRTLNRTHRKIDKPTDVLSFPVQLIRRRENEVRSTKGNMEFRFNDPVLHASCPMLHALGSVVICPKVAKKYNESIIDLVVHGLIHLIGYDHEKDGDNDQFCKINEEFCTRFSGR